MKPIQEQFVAAARLVNEWRDTLFYTGVAVVAGVMLTHGGGVKDLHFLGEIIGQREFLRFATWGPMNGLQRNTQFVGFSRKTVNNRLNAFAAVMVAEGVWLLNGNLLPITSNHTMGNLIDGAFLIGGTAYLKLFGGNVKDIPSLYFDKDIGMWDWPRKRDGGGGTTQTQKLIKGMKELGRGLAGWAPVPSPGAARVPVSSRRCNIN